MWRNSDSRAIYTQREHPRDESYKNRYYRELKWRPQDLYLFGRVRAGRSTRRIVLFTSALWTGINWSNRTWSNVCLSCGYQRGFSNVVIIRTLIETHFVHIKFHYQESNTRSFSVLFYFKPFWSSKYKRKFQFFT